jgi:hypothetical protein
MKKNPVDPVNPVQIGFNKNRIHTLFLYLTEEGSHL